MKKILIPTKLESIASDILTRRGYHVITDAETPIPELAKIHPDAAALIVRSEKITADIIDSFPKLKLIIRAGAGFDTIDIAHARKRNVDVMNTPGANANAVAEEVIALILAQYRFVVKADNSTRAGKWEKKNFMGRELTGKTVGIIGLGNIGRLVAKRLTGFENKIIGYDPVLSPQKAREIGIEPCSLEQIFTNADIITIHVPGSPETKNMINEELLKLAKPNCLLINCARYGIVDEDALRAIKQVKPIHYCNDVYPEDKAGDKAVADIADVMLPHLGANTYEANQVAARRAAEQLIAYVEHGLTTYVVNKGTPDDLDPHYQYLAYCLANFAKQAIPGKSIHRIACTYYGDLNRQAKWFSAPILAGLSPDFDAGLMPKDAENVLRQQGVFLEINNPDESKEYGNSITLDLFAGEDDDIEQISVRGTIAEGTIMLSRFSSFNRLYMEMKGNTLVMVYHDRPGVFAQISSNLAAQNINIENVIAPHDSQRGISMSLFKTDKEIPKALIKKIAEEIQAIRGFAVILN